MATSGVRALAAGGSTCAVFVDGSLKCWGNVDGYNNENISKLSALARPFLFGGGVVQASVGAKHQCAVFNTSALRCWGEGGSGRLGNGGTSGVSDAASASALIFSSGVSQVSAGSGHTCAVFENGSLRCWGFGENGRLGNGGKLRSLMPETPLRSSSIRGSPRFRQEMVILARFSKVALSAAGALTVMGASEPELG